MASITQPLRMELWHQVRWTYLFCQQESCIDLHWRVAFHTGPEKMMNKYRPNDVLWGVDWAISLIFSVTWIRETDISKASNSSVQGQCCGL